MELEPECTEPTEPKTTLKCQTKKLNSCRVQYTDSNGKITSFSKVELSEPCTSKDLYGFLKQLLNTDLSHCLLMTMNSTETNGKLLVESSENVFPLLHNGIVKVFHLGKPRTEIVGASQLCDYKDTMAPDETRNSPVRLYFHFNGDRLVTGNKCLAVDKSPFWTTMVDLQNDSINSLLERLKEKIEQDKRPWLRFLLNPMSITFKTDMRSRFYFKTLDLSTLRSLPLGQLITEFIKQSGNTQDSLYLKKNETVAKIHFSPLPSCVYCLKHEVTKCEESECQQHAHFECSNFKCKKLYCEKHFNFCSTPNCSKGCGSCCILDETTETTKTKCFHCLEQEEESGEPYTVRVNYVPIFEGDLDKLPSLQHSVLFQGQTKFNNLRDLLDSLDSFDLTETPFGTIAFAIGNSNKQRHIGYTANSTNLTRTIFNDKTSNQVYLIAPAIYCNCNPLALAHTEHSQKCPACQKEVKSFLERPLWTGDKEDRRRTYEVFFHHFMPTMIPASPFCMEDSPLFLSTNQATPLYKAWVVFSKTEMSDLLHQIKEQVGKVWLDHSQAMFIENSQKTYMIGLMSDDPSFMSHTLDMYANRDTQIKIHLFLYNKIKCTCPANRDPICYRCGFPAVVGDNDNYQSNDQSNDSGSDQSNDQSNDETNDESNDESSSESSEESEESSSESSEASEESNSNEEGMAKNSIQVILMEIAKTKTQLEERKNDFCSQLNRVVNLPERLKVLTESQIPLKRKRCVEEFQELLVVPTFDDLLHQAEMLIEHGQDMVSQCFSCGSTDDNNELRSCDRCFHNVCSICSTQEGLCSYCDGASKGKESDRLFSKLSKIGAFETNAVSFLDKTKLILDDLDTKLNTYKQKFQKIV